MLGYHVDMSSGRESLRILTELTRHLSAEEPLEDSLRAFTDAAVLLAPASHASVRLFDESGTELIAYARSGEGVSQRPAQFRPGEGLLGWAAASGERLRVDDTRSDERFATKTGQGFSVLSVIAVPLWSAGRVVGVFALSSPEAAAFSEDDELLAQLLANCAVPTIERARLRHLAVTDDGTRSFNRRYLMPRLQREIARAKTISRPLSLLSLDLDHFKNVNDTHGHAVGDDVLSIFVERILSMVRGHDVLVRRGGDEFVLLMPGAKLQQAGRVAERIRKRLEENAVVCRDGTPVELTVTIGVATWDGRESAEDFEVRTDRAMYRGKQGGRNQVILDCVDDPLVARGS